jgi:hypothetical protein
MKMLYKVFVTAPNYDYVNAVYFVVAQSCGEAEKKRSVML